MVERSSPATTDALRAAAERVCWFDWSDNDTDAAAAIDALRKVVTATSGPAAPTNSSAESGGWHRELIDREPDHGQYGYDAQASRITGARNQVEEAACLIWAELCPGMVMSDDDLPHYEAAARAVLALPRPHRESPND